MNISELSFIVIFFFTTHEFEEILCIRNWIKKNEKEENLQKETFIAGKEHYPSTETISLMILEEFVIVSIILYVAIKFQSIEVVIGFSLLIRFIYLDIFSKP